MGNFKKEYKKWLIKIQSTSPRHQYNFPFIHHNINATARQEQGLINMTAFAADPTPVI